MGESSLGKLVVEIGADLSDLNKNLGEASKKVQDASVKMLDATQKMSKKITLVGAAISGAFGLMIKSAVDYGDQLYDVSQRTGVAVESLSRLKYVAEQTESSFEAVATGLKFLNKNIYEAGTGNKELAETFDALSINVRNLDGSFRDAESVMLQIADVFSKTDDNAAKTALAMRVFGRSGTDLVPILNLGSKGIKELSEEADRLGLVLSTQNAKDIDAFSDGMKALKSATGGLWLELSKNLIPALTDLAKKATDIISSFRQWSEQNSGLAKSLIEWTAKLTLAAGAIAVIAGGIVGLIKNLKEFYALILLATNATAAFTAFRLGGLLTDIGILVTNVGIIYPAVVLIGTTLAAWNIGKLIGQIKQVQGFFDWVVGADKAKAFEEQATAENQKAVAAKQASYPSPVDLGTITVDKTQQEIDSQMELRQVYVDNEEIYRQVQDGMLVADSNRQIAQITLERAHMEERQQMVQTYNQLWIQGHASMWAFTNSFIQSFQQEMSKAISSIILGTQKAGDAFKQLGKAMVQMIVEYLAQQAVAWAISTALQALVKTTASTMASSLALAWAPAAFAASVATMGGAAAAGTAALATGLATSVAMMGGAAAAGGKFADGTDTVPAMLTPGEMIIPRSFSDAIRSGDLTLAGRGAFGGNGATTQNISITMNNVINSELDIDRVAERLGLDIEEKLRGVR